MTEPSGSRERPFPAEEGTQPLSTDHTQVMGPGSQAPQHPAPHQAAPAHPQWQRPPSGQPQPNPHQQPQPWGAPANPYQPPSSAPPGGRRPRRTVSLLGAATAVAATALLAGVTGGAVGGLAAEREADSGVVTLDAPPLDLSLIHI